jgi:threonine dehydratase
MVDRNAAEGFSGGRGRLEGIPAMADLLEARAVVKRYFRPTPFHFSHGLSRRCGCEVYVKYENCSPIRSFKVRGALYSLWRLTPEERRAGVITESTGNHGQGIAYAGRILGIPSTIVVPSVTPELKRQAIRSFGGELCVFGRDVSETGPQARKLAAESGKTLIEDGADGGLMAGAATVAWEILEDLPDVQVLIVPVGSGNFIAATCLVAKRLNPAIRVVGVQAEGAAAAALSLKAGTIVQGPINTFAEGIADSAPGTLAFEVMKRDVDDMVLVSEEELQRSIVTVLSETGQVAEGAGAAAFAALEKHRSRWAGSKVVPILSGGNLPLELLHTFLHR